MSNEQLMDVFRRLLERYGPQNWWPGETWFEVMAGAVLVQSTSWTNVEKAIANLKNEGLLSPSAIRRTDQDTLAELVYSCGFYNAKARKLKALAEFIGSRWSDDVESANRNDADLLRSELLAVHGIGEETADAILLYAVNIPSFVIDAYTIRVFSRLKLLSETGRYSQHQQWFMDSLPPDAQLFGEYHALIVRHGKERCRKSPICDGCCLFEICPKGQNLIAQTSTTVE
jgi:endonuclease-3 related protein